MNEAKHTHALLPARISQNNTYRQWGKKRRILIRSCKAVFRVCESEGDGHGDEDRDEDTRQRETKAENRQKNTEYIEYKPKTHDAWGEQQQLRGSRSNNNKKRHIHIRAENEQHFWPTATLIIYRLNYRLHCNILYNMYIVKKKPDNFKVHTHKHTLQPRQTFPTNSFLLHSILFKFKFVYARTHTLIYYKLFFFLHVHKQKYVRKLCTTYFSLSSRFSRFVCMFSSSSSCLVVYWL